MYFSKFPLTTYTLNGKTESVVDIFRKVVLSKTNSSTIYNEVLVQDADTLESLAEKYYGDSNLAWVILLTNDIIDPNSEFILSSENLQSLLNTKYSGDIAYFEENLDLQEGDILISLDQSSGEIGNTLAPSQLTSSMLDTDNYCFVNSYNNEFRYARITNVGGTLGDETSTPPFKMVGYRKINGSLDLITFDKTFTTGGTVQEAAILPLIKIDSYVNSPVYFYDNALSQIISPYKKYNGSSLTEDYVNIDANGAFTGLTNDNAFRQSILWKIAMKSQNVNDVSYTTLGQQIRDNNEKFRTIKILPTNLIAPFIEVFNDLISNDNIRFRIISTKE
jgi:hypothetical protein